MEGYLPDGATPKNRLVFAPETRRTHGKMAGKFKYMNPDTEEPYECWVWETWYPASMCGDRETWQYELLGPYPADCNLECCNGGFWGLRSIIATPQSAYIALTEETLLSIEQKQFMDLEWSMLTEVERQRQLDASLSAREQKADEESLEEYLKILDNYSTNKEEMDNADNRVFSWADKYMIGGKNSKMPVGAPKIKI